MQLNVAYVDDNAFDTVMFGLPHPGTIRYLENQMMNLQQQAQAYGLSQSFVDRAYESFQSFASAEALERAKAIVHQHTGDTLHHVSCLTALAELQTAPINMQRWIMANPYIREQYHANRLDGYSDSYVDFAPGAVGDMHYDYRRVMDGVFVFNEDPEDSVDWTFSTYYEDLENPDTDELDLTEQLQVLRTWEALEYFVRHTDEDPTNPTGGSR
jgi:hypothetical protein|nr:MAG TPA: hypothetical protein [Caudoviricetes sp.]